MKSPAEHQTIQVELTSACVLRCSNCTRFCGSHREPFFLEPERFRAAIDSLVGYAELQHAVVGFMGGEPLLHPRFAEYCEYALSKIPREKLGLWSTFPDAPKYKAYAELICKTFGNILLNDHSRDDILHAPVLMAAEEYFRKPCPVCCKAGATVGAAWCTTCGGTGTVTDERSLFASVNHCWVQESWSSSINPKGAWFCEVAAALSDLFDGPEGWKVEPGWWMRTPMEFREQMDWACRKCGAALPLERVRNSQDNRDDVSAANLERLKAIKSRKVARGEYALREEFKFDTKLLQNHGYPSQTYKDAEYRQGIASRYGIRLVLNARGYWEPTMAPQGWKTEPAGPAPLFNILQERYTTHSVPQQNEGGAARLSPVGGD